MYLESRAVPIKVHDIFIQKLAAGLLVLVSVMNLDWSEISNGVIHWLIFKEPVGSSNYFNGHNSKEFNNLSPR